jgi:hypothetical protein
MHTPPIYQEAGHRDSGFFAAIFAWETGLLSSKSHELMQAMDMSPHQFCLDPASSFKKA